MTNESLLDALRRSGLIADEVLERLRRQLASAGGNFGPQAAVAQLVTEGHLTKAQGERLLAAGSPPVARHATIEVEPDDELEVLPDDDLPSPPRPGKVQAGRSQADDLEVLPDGDDDLLPPPPPPSTRPRSKPSPSEAQTVGFGGDELELAPLDDDPLLRSPLRAAPSASPKTQGKPAPTGAEPKKSAKKKRRNTWRNEVAAAAPQLADQVDDLLDTGSAAGARAARARQAGARKSWDSPLLLIGGGSLIGLVLLGAILLWLTRRQTGDQALEMAEQDYNASSYSQAIQKFDQYLEKFPKHGSVSIARVHRGLAEMRQANQAADWPKALLVAKQVVEQISTEPQFHEAQADLAAILPEIARGLAARARDKPSVELVAGTREAAALVDKYVPVNLQPVDQLREIEGSLALTERHLNRDQTLAESLAKMTAAVEAGNPQQAYATRRELLRSYPDLATAEPLLKAMAAAAEGERVAVKYVEEPRAAASDDPAAATIASVALTSTAGNPAPIEERESVLILDSPAVFALDPRTGKPRWRRFVGFEAATVPQVVKTAAGSAVLLVDPLNEGISLVDAASGKLRWRQSVEGPPATPLVVRDRVLVATRSGKLLVLDTESGQQRGYIQVPQPLRVAPVVEPRERLYYQLAEHSNLYVLAAESGECREVFYLGHEPESIAVPPLLVGRYLIIVENRGPEDSVLRVLLADEDGLKLKAVEQAPLRGHVFSPPASSGRALVIATDRGALYSFELGAPDSGKILTKLAEKPPDDKPPLVPSVASRGSELWLAGFGVTRYDIQASRGALAPKWIKEEQSVVLHAPSIVGPALIFATRGDRSAGATVCAINGVDGAVFWETRLDVPLVVPPIVAAGADKAIAVTAAGAVYEVPAAGLANRKLIDTPAAAVADKLNLPSGGPLVELADGRYVFATARGDSLAGVRDILIYDSQASGEKLRRRKLAEPAANWPVAFGGGLLVPGKIGQVFVVDPDTSKNLVAPFQPVVEVGREIAWTEPTVLNNDQVLISDGATKLYRLAVAAEPRPHLEAAATVNLATPLISAAAVAGSHIYVVDAGHRLLSFRLPDLSPGKDWALDGRAVWGPRRVGDQVLAATLSGQLTCAGGDGELLWQVALEPGCVISDPIVSAAGVIVGMTGGGVNRLAADSGQVLSTTALGQPLALGPALWHQRLVFAGSDGTLHIVAQPK